MMRSKPVMVSGASNCKCNTDPWLNVDSDCEDDPSRVTQPDIVFDHDLIGLNLVHDHGPHINEALSRSVLIMPPALTQTLKIIDI